MPSTAPRVSVPIREQINSTPMRAGAGTSNSYSRDFYAPRSFPKDAGLHPSLWAVPVLGNLADAWSTQFRLRQGAVEANPFMSPFTKHPGLFYGLKAGVGLATALLANRLAKSGRKRAAKVVAIVGGAVPLAAAAYNMGSR